VIKKKKKSLSDAPIEPPTSECTKTKKKSIHEILASFTHSLQNILIIIDAVIMKMQHLKFSVALLICRALN